MVHWTAIWLHLNICMFRVRILTYSRLTRSRLIHYDLLTFCKFTLDIYYAYFTSRSACIVSKYVWVKMLLTNGVCSRFFHNNNEHIVKSFKRMGVENLGVFRVKIRTDFMVSIFSEYEIYRKMVCCDLCVLF